MALKLYPENYEINKDRPARSEDGRNKMLAKRIIRYAVRSSDVPMEDWQLVNLVCGNLCRECIEELIPLRSNRIAINAKLTELAIPIVSVRTTEEERSEILRRAMNNENLIGHRDVRSLSRKEVLECIKEVIEERKSTWTYIESDVEGP